MSCNYFERSRYSSVNLAHKTTSLTSFIRENMVPMGFGKLGVTLEVEEESKTLDTCFLVMVRSSI